MEALVANLPTSIEEFLPALEHEESDFVGRRVEEVVPNTLMAQVIESG